MNFIEIVKMLITILQLLIKSRKKQREKNRRWISITIVEKHEGKHTKITIEVE